MKEEIANAGAINHCFLGDSVVSVRLEVIKADLEKLKPTDKTSIAFTAFGKLGGDCWNIANVAESMGVSVRTLQRRLEEAGSSYGYLRDLARFIAAIELLKAGEAIKDIAEMLGFSDRTSFTNAMLRWYGFTPAALRLLLRSTREPVKQ